MTTYGEYLRQIVDSNRVNIYNLAKHISIERTLIHKFMTNTRIPSDEQAHKLADALPLTPHERIRLLEHHKIAKIGELKYRQRIQIKDLIESIAYIEQAHSPNMTVTTHAHVPKGEASTVAVGSFAVNNLIKSLIEEAMLSSNPSLNFVIPDDYHFFYTELLACYIKCPGMHIRHLVAFSKKTDLPSNTNTNVGVLSQVLPLAFAPGTGYHPSYFYKSSRALDLTQAMPYFALTSTGRLVLISGDLSKAVLINDSSLVNLYSESFETMVGMAKPLMKKIDSMAEIMNLYVKITIEGEDEPFHWIEPEPCIGPLITRDMISMCLNDNLPNRNELVEIICQNNKNLRAIKRRNINACTADGIYRMINTGRVYNVPIDIIDSFPREIMKELLDILKQRVSSNEIRFHITNPSKMVLPKKTLTSMGKKTGILFVWHGNGKSEDFRAIHLSEESINEAFIDFAESLSDSGLVYSEDDSLEMLDSIYGEYFA